MSLGLPPPHLQVLIATTTSQQFITINHHRSQPPSALDIGSTQLQLLCSNRSCPGPRLSLYTSRLLSAPTPRARALSSAAAMDSFTALPPCSPITMAAITPPPLDHRSSLSAAVLFLCRGSQRRRHQSQATKSPSRIQTRSTSAGLKERHSLGMALGVGV
ncbi:hypothetical protein M0R45_008223 [Rubus argutus]|uniref:Uncharacterized protein n=1 Tax=Rubus argutus TaxID=59490 RepID=A0AAW1Y3V2_RUBAR